MLPYQLHYDYAKMNNENSTRDREERSKEERETRRWGVGKEVTQCLLGHSTLDPLRRIFSGHVSARLSGFPNRFKKRPKIFGDGYRSA